MRIPLHGHQSPTFSLQLEGAVLERLNGRDIECVPLTGTFKPAGERHANRVGPEGGRSFIVECDDAKVGSFLQERDLIPRALDAVAVARLLAVFERFRENDALLPLAVEELCLSFVRDLRRRDLPAGRSRGGERVRRAVEVIRSRESAGVRVSDLAKEAGIHPVYLARLFQRLLGCSVTDYVQRVRLERAMTLLRRGDRSIAEVALAAGFFDQSHLTRSLRRLTGYSPLGYRMAAAKIAGMFSKSPDLPLPPR